jgi:RHS repeat-associated protein
LGSTSLITNSTGGRIEETLYEPFGSIWGNGGQKSRFEYTGKELDDTGLQYFGARFYNPAIGKWTQPDTTLESIYEPQKQNRFAYVTNNPFRYKDPDGHFVAEFTLNPSYSLLASGGADVGVEASFDCEEGYHLYFIGTPEGGASTTSIKYSITGSATIYPNFKRGEETSGWGLTGTGGAYLGSGGEGKAVWMANGKQNNPNNLIGKDGFLNNVGSNPVGYGVNVGAGWGGGGSGTLGYSYVKNVDALKYVDIFNTLLYESSLSVVCDIAGKKESHSTSHSHKNSKSQSGWVQDKYGGYDSNLGYHDEQKQQSIVYKKDTFNYAKC